MPTALLIAGAMCALLILLTGSVLLDIVLVIAASLLLMMRLAILSRAALLTFLVLTAAPIVAFMKWLEPAIEAQAGSVATRAVNSELDIAESTIDRFLSANAAALDAIGILVSQNPDVSEAQYHKWLSRVLPRQRNQFINVALSTDLILNYVYPQVPANNRLIGIYLGDVADQGALYERANQTRMPTIIGPVTLLQGMPGMIYVRPVVDNSNKIISGVLSLTYLKDELTAVLSPSTEFSLNLASPTQDLQLITSLRNPEQRLLHREFKIGDIRVTMSASSKELDRLMVQTRFISQFSALAFWLVLSFIIAWVHRNYILREQQQQALKANKQELIAAQRLGQMGSWNRTPEGRLKLSEPLQDMLSLATDDIEVAELIAHVHTDDKSAINRQINGFFNSQASQLALEHRLLVDGQFHWFEHRIARNDDGLCRGILRDINKLRIRDAQLAKLESFDSLTGAANRHYFKQLTIQNIALCERRRSSLALILVNIDNFRAVNETYGHVSGDELLKQIVQRLLQTSRKSDTVARLAGDTFAISLNDVGSNKQSVLVIEKILRRLKEPYALAEEVLPQFTMGASMYPNDAHDYETLLRMAESALSNAKKEARGHYRFYSAELSEQTDRRQKILASLPIAIRNSDFNLVFQPRVDSAPPCHVTGMEVLLRWHDPIIGEISPAEFIPMAEQSTLINEIGYWVMEQTFAAVAQHQNMIPEGLIFSMNLSSRQLEDALLLRNVHQLIEKYQVKASQFELEITEHSISEESENIVSNMQLLNDLGFQFAIDDFGTGYSNLSNLQSLPLHVLKIDMHFIRAIGTSERSDELVKAIVNMGHTLGLRVVAEGVESAAQVQFLRKLNCEELQGFYFFKPAALDEILPQLNRGDIAASRSG